MTKIEELIKQSTYDILGVKQVDHKQLVELVVQECANVILEWKSEPFPLDPDFAAKQIKEHFGIE